MSGYENLTVTTFNGTSISHTVSEGQNMFFAMGGFHLNFPAPSTPTYNGVGMVQARSGGFGGFAWHGVYYLKNPTIGAHTFNGTEEGKWMLISAKAGDFVPDNPVVATQAQEHNNNDTLAQNFGSQNVGRISLNSAVKGSNASWTGLDQEFSPTGVGSGYEISAAGNSFTLNGTYGSSGDSYITRSGAVIEVGLDFVVSGNAFWFSLAGISIPVATLAGLYKAGAVVL